MLNDISGLGDWHKVSAGLLRLFQGEVLGKFPVVQHLYFGSIIEATWVGPVVVDASSNRALSIDPLTTNGPASLPSVATHTDADTHSVSACPRSAEGLAGIVFNPASVACRAPWAGAELRS